MAILWDKLEKTIKSYLLRGNKDGYRKFSYVADYIQTQYLLEIRTNATDPFGNKIVNFGSGVGLKPTLIQAFNSCFNTRSVRPLNTQALLGVKLHWASAQMGIAIPVLPAMTVGIQNTVNIVGEVPPMNVRNNNNNDILAKEIIKSLKAHSKTIGGTFSGLNTLTTPPIPIIIKWTGIQ